MKIAAFVSEDDRLIRELADRFDIVVSDRSKLGDLGEGCEFYDLGHDEDRILELFEQKRVSTAVALGYRRLFSPEFLEQCDAELYNLHPSLLPAFKGLDVYERVLDRGVKYSGATLHRISEEMDEGEIIDQVVYRVTERRSVKELKEVAVKHEIELIEENLL